MKSARWARYLYVPPLLFAVLCAVLGVLKYREIEREARASAPGTRNDDGLNQLHDRVLGTALPVLWEAPSFSLTDQDGKAFSSTALRGHVWIADFIYTECTTACPLMTARMVLVQKRLAGPGPGGDVRFVSFSVDPEHDTPAVLEAYAARWHGDSARWRLLATTPKTLAGLVQGMRVFVNRTDDPASPISHSDEMFLVDAAGRVRGVYASDDEPSMRVLAEDAAALAGGHAAPVSAVGGAISGTAPAGPATVGAHLYASLGCPACHQRPRVAPSLAGIAGAAVALDDGTSVRADAAYLRRSIVSPGSQVVKGYQALMPSYADYLDDAQVAALVSYIDTLGGPHGRPATAPAPFLSTDPVCGMKITVVAGTPRARYAGRDYYFCSDTCREKFEKDPARYSGTH